MKFSLVMFKNDISDNPKKPFFKVILKDEDGNEYEGGLWYASDDQGNKKVSKGGDHYWTGKAETAKSFSGKKAPAAKKPAREENPF